MINDSKKGKSVEGILANPIPATKFASVVALTMTAETSNEVSGTSISDSAVMSLNLDETQNLTLERGDACYFKVRILCVSMDYGYAISMYGGEIAAYRLGLTGVAPVGGGMSLLQQEGGGDYEGFPDVPVIAMNGNDIEITVQHTSSTGVAAKYRWVAEISGPTIGGGFLS